MHIVDPDQMALCSVQTWSALFANVFLMGHKKHVGIG